VSSSDPRLIAFTVLGRVVEGAYSDLALDAELTRHRGLEARDRALATELVYGVLRTRGRLDHALQKACRQPLVKLEEPVLRLLRLGAYQLLCLDRIPESAAVNTTVELARKVRLERATGFLNGVLRGLLRGLAAMRWPDPADAPLEYLSHWLSLPEWLARRWLTELGAEAALRLGEALLRPAPLTVRVNTLKTTVEAVAKLLSAKGHSVERCRYAAEGLLVTGRQALEALAPDSFQIQDQASMLVAHLLGAVPGDRILDACSAPGGKTTHLAALAGNRAEILALDLHPRRVELVRKGAERLGCQGIEARAWDLRQPPRFLAAGSFDRILLDAPCSGLGVLRRSPELRWRRQPEEIEQLAGLQLTLLQQVAPLLRPGGVLLYSLCTTTPEETEGVIQKFQSACPELVRVDLRSELPPGWQELLDGTGALRTSPVRHDGMDGFFAVRFLRKA